MNLKDDKVSNESHSNNSEDSNDSLNSYALPVYYGSEAMQKRIKLFRDIHSKHIIAENSKTTQT